MEVKASSIYDLKTIKALVHLQIFKKSNPVKSLIIYETCCIVLILLGIVRMIILGYSIDMLILIICLLLLSLFYGFAYFITPKIRYKAAAKFVDMQNEFVFYEDEMAISSSNKEYSGDGSLKYSILFKAMETKEYLFLFQNKMQVYVVDKSTFENDTFGKVRQSLVSALGKKYEICKY